MPIYAVASATEPSNTYLITTTTTIPKKGEKPVRERPAASAAKKLARIKNIVRVKRLFDRDHVINRRTHFLM